MRNKFMRFMLAVCAGVASLASLAVTQVDIEHDTSGVRPGYWTSDFAAAKAYADANHMPFVGFWGSAGCGYCALMKSTGLLSDEFKAWVEKNKIVMCYVEVPADKTSVVTDAKTFIKGTNKSGLYPFMCFYWPKANGTTTSVFFSGRKGSIPPYAKGTLGAQFVAGLDNYFAGYEPVETYSGGYFAVTNAASARLEAVVNKTTYVDVPLVRTAKTAAENYLKVGTAANVKISWAANVTNQTYKYTLTAAEKAMKGAIALKLFDKDGTTVKSTSAINVVDEPAVSTMNPKWVGESFDYGEWTMDYEAAKKKSGYILAEFGGSLWCPDCYGADNSLFESEDFYKWAKDNKVMLVVFDQGRASNPATAAGNGTARLLTYDEGKSSFLAGGTASGASYLSRKSISAAAAKARIDMTTKYTKEWLAPGSAAARMGNPTMVLVKNDKVIARVNLLEAADRTFDPAENLARLKALLELSDGDANDFLKTATQTLAVEGDARGALQVNNPSKFYKLTNVPVGKVTFTATATTTAGKAVKPTVTVYDGTDSSSPKSLGSGAGSATVTFTSTANQYLAVTYFDGDTKFGDDNHASYTVSSAVTLVPSATAATYKTASGRVNLSVTAGLKYKLGGFSAYDGLTKNADGTYTAAKTATLAMTAAKGATVSYQIWTDSKLQFTTTSAKKMETDGSGTIQVSRTGGSSGQAVATVSADKGSLGTGRVSVSPATLTWKDGETAAKTVTYKIAADDAVRADETFTITLANGAGSAATLGAATKFTLTLSDTDDPVLPASSYSLTVFRKYAVSQAYAVSNIKENGRVTVNRTGTLPTGVKLSYDATTKRVVLSGSPSRAGTYEFGVSVSERRANGTATGKTTTFKVTVSDPLKLKPGDAGYNAVLAAGSTVYGSVPLYGTLSGRKVTAGVATVKFLRTGRTSVTYAGADGVRSTFSGQPTLSQDGTARVVASRGSATATLSVTSAGRATLSVTGLSTRFGSSLASETSGIMLVGGNRSAYSGYYTVTLPVDAGATGKTEAATGTGYVILKMNTASFTRTGKVNYAGMLGNGTIFSGNAYLSGDQLTQDGSTWAYLPVSVSKSGASAAFVLRVRKNASTTYEGDPQTVLAADAAKPYMIANDIVAWLNTYGGVYDRNMDFAFALDEYYATTKFSVGYGTGLFADSDRYGSVKTLPSATVTVGSRGAFSVANADGAHALSLRLATATGIVTGRMPVTFSSGRKVTLTIKGVLLPGWADCGCFEVSEIVLRPLFSGAAYYSDQIDGRTAKRGFAVDFQY
ncbi:MAG: hypothetical protein IJ829_00480 [Kiritimatiellae bacterium]|nr:hypothetical protein [Kiritimatiellia bacterium]